MHVTNELFNNIFTKKKKNLTRNKKKRSLSFIRFIGMNIAITILT